MTVELYDGIVLVVNENEDFWFQKDSATCRTFRLKNVLLNENFVQKHLFFNSNHEWPPR